MLALHAIAFNPLLHLTVFKSHIPFIHRWSQVREKESKNRLERFFCIFPPQICTHRTAPWPYPITTSLRSQMSFFEARNPKLKATLPKNRDSASFLAAGTPINDSTSKHPSILSTQLTQPDDCGGKKNFVTCFLALKHLPKQWVNPAHG